jgi:SAM-dependent methyltransferase
MDHEVLFPSFYLGRVSKLQKIVICRDCGMIFRNPHIPGLCEEHYQEVTNWGADNPHYEQRSAKIAQEIAARVEVGNGLFSDVGCGPGWLAERLAAVFPDARAVLFEPSVHVAEHAQSRNPASVVIPGFLSEATLPENAFALITACGVDYLFQNHRRDMEIVRSMLIEGGVFYIERNVFVEQPSYCQQPIFDMDDLFGLNDRMNTWFGREQFVQYLSGFFEVFDTIDYVSDVSPAPYSRTDDFRGVFCRKVAPGRKRKNSKPANRYREHLDALRSRARDSSLEDLKLLAEVGVRRVLLFGGKEETADLAALIGQVEGLRIAGIIETGSARPTTLEFREALPGIDQSEPINGVLVASIVYQRECLQVLQRAGLGRISFPCFRDGIDRFMSGGATPIQMKAFLPTLLASR